MIVASNLWGIKACADSIGQDWNKYWTDHSYNEPYTKQACTGHVSWGILVLLKAWTLHFDPTTK